jgi:hypothetical protein
MEFIGLAMTPGTRVSFLREGFLFFFRDVAGIMAWRAAFSCNKAVCRLGREIIALAVTGNIFGFGTENCRKERIRLILHDKPDFSKLISQGHV